MPAQYISDSPNIAVLDSQVIVDACNGTFNIDISPSVFIGSGASNILGVSVRVDNISRGTITKDYPSSGYDITTPFTGVVAVTIPTIAGSYQYGTFNATVLLTDAGGTTYTLTKSVKICAPAGSNNGKYGSLSADLRGNCKAGVLNVVADTPPNYNGEEYESAVNAFTLNYPTSSQLSPLSSTLSNFQVKLYQGVYEFTGSACVTYSVGDHIYYKVKYNYKREKNIKCSINNECISERIAGLVEELNTDCSDKERRETESTVTQTLLLLKTIDTLADTGYDYSDYITQLEDVLGCVCTCNCEEGTPVNPGDIANSVVINGCGITSTTVGLTTTYTINNYDFVVGITPNGGALTISSSVINGCTKTQTITLNIPTLYAQIKGQVNKQSEWDFWAGVWKKALNGLDPACLGFTQAQFVNLTAAQLMQAIINLGCQGGVCNGVILNDSTTTTGNNVNINWVIESGSPVYETDIYLDGVKKGSVLAPTSTYTLTGAGDGLSHNYDLVARCANGSVGTSLEGSFTYVGCPFIAPPILVNAGIGDATCPINLNTYIYGSAPAGIVYEWHNFNSTSPQTVVANPTSVGTGVYFLFAKDGNGCYSTGVEFTLTCSDVSNCSAPQGLVVDAVTGGLRVRFSSAAYPPSSYTVKRRLSSTSDVDANYTTIGTPTWNATVNKWEIVDNTANNNVLYVYRAISNCSGSAPYVDTTYANIACVTMTLTSAPDTMEVSLTRTNNLLSAHITGGTPPYNYTFSVVTDGYCEAHTIATPTGTTSTNFASTGYTWTAYAGTAYSFKCTVVDAASVSVDSDLAEIPPCLVPETMISVIDGMKRLDELKKGDMLSEANKVEQWQERQVNELYVINGGLLKSSKGHLHIINDGGKESIIAAYNLEKGMILISKHGEVKITNIEVREGKFKVINIETTDGTYWANGILTHNKLACP